MSELATLDPEQLCGSGCFELHFHCLRWLISLDCGVNQWQLMPLCVARSVFVASQLITLKMLTFALFSPLKTKRNRHVISSAYADEKFQPIDQSRVTRIFKFKSNLPFRKSNTGQKYSSYLWPKIWNNLSCDSKSTNSINSFQHKIKRNSFPKYTARETTYMCSTKTAHPPSLS